MSDESIKSPFETIAATAELANMGVLVTSTEEHGLPRTLFASRKIEQLLGFSTEDILTRPFSAYIAEDELPRLLAAREERYKTESLPAFQETVVVTRDGRRVPIETFNNVTEVDGQKVSLTFIREITDRKIAEEKLRRSEQRFRTLVENAPDGVTILRGLQIVYINSVAARLMGVADPNDALGKSITQFISPVDVERVKERLKTMGPPGAALREPTLYHTVDAQGRNRTVEVVSLPIEYRGEPAVLGFARDVTERVEMQTKIVRADRLSALGIMAAGIAHEINNPLAYVLISLIRAKKKLSDIAQVDSAEICQLLDDAQEGVERISGIVRDVQRYAQPIDEERMNVSIEGAMERALNLAGHVIGQHTRVIRRYLNVPEVFGSAARIEQLFLNLVINAAQALESAAIPNREINVSISPAIDGVMVEIVDTGCGMSEATLKRIFDPFFTTKPAGKGTGLGLAICKSIVDELGGEITVSSALGQGTQFRISIPANDPPVADETLSDAASTRSVNSPRSIVEAQQSDLSTEKKNKLLLIDDEPKVAETLKACLSNEFDVDAASCGSEALKAIKTGTRYDAILCDFVMPKMNGVEFLKNLRETEPTLVDRTVMMTGMIGPERMQAFGPDFTCPLLQKPFHPEKARDILLDIIRRRSF